MKDEFTDLLKFSEESLKDVWYNEDNNIWSNYLKNEMSNM